MIYVSNGNIRMKIPTFSILSELTCPNSTELCRKNCYAKKAERYPNAYTSRFRNTVETLKETFVDEIVKVINSTDSKYIRIHESGDFYSQTYLDKWFEVCRKIKNKSFLAYTQMYNLSWFNKPNNMIVYWSIWPDTNYKPCGLKAYVIDNGKGIIPKYKDYNGFVCKKGKESKVMCDVCLYCYKGMGNVVFKIH